MGCAKDDDANGTTAQGRAVSSAGRYCSAAGCWRPVYNFGAAWHPLRCPIPALRGPSGNASGHHALLGIVVQATNCVARLMIIPILAATRSARICSASLETITGALTGLTGRRQFLQFHYPDRSGNHLLLRIRLLIYGTNIA